MPTLRRFRSGPHGGVACDADLEAVAALPPRPSKPAWPRCLPSDDSAPDRTEASLAMPTWRPWRLCRRGRLNPLGRDAYPQTIPLRTARRRRLRCRPGGRGGFAAAAVQTRLAETPTLRRFRSAPHGGVACDADLEAVTALPPRPSKPGWPRRLPSDDSAPHRIHRGLDAVVDLKLHQDVRDVVLDRLRADVQVGGDLGFVLAVRDQLQDLDLAVGELRSDCLLGVRRRGGGAHAFEH